MAKFKGIGSTDQNIIQTIGYITDNRYIASYYGIDVQRVIELRKKIGNVKPEVKQPEVEHATTAKPKSYSTGLNSDCERKWNKKAKKGSAALLKALLKFFANREQRIRRGEAP